MSVIPGILMAGASLVGAAGALKQGKENAAAEQRRSTLLRKDAAQARRLGAIEADLIQRETEREVGAALARAAEGGFTADSAAALIGQLAGDYAYQAQTARYEADRQARSLLNEAAEGEIRAKQHKRAGVLNAVGGVLEAGAHLAGSIAPAGGPS